jgi:hypothetical protein
MVPGQVQAPSPYSNLSAIYPNLSGTNSQISSNILNQLQGNLSPGVINNIQNQGAAWGVQSGMPGSGAAGSNMLASLGLPSEGLQQQGVANYNATLPTMYGTQTLNPALQTEIAGYNATNAAAPDPTQAASYAKTLFDEYLAKMNPAGGTNPLGGSMNYSIPGGLQMPQRPTTDWMGTLNDSAFNLYGSQSPYTIFG